ncbi:MAG: imidazolonepropionase [Bacteroidales bacterium]|nr:imidazolonepropionase [Bacteroidales bacterium]
MTTILNIGELVGIVPEGVLRKQGAEMSETGSIRDAWLRIADDGTILDFGSMSHYRPAADPADRLWPLRTGGAQGPQPDDNGAMVIDAEGGLLMPGFCDSHTHIVYAGSREGEFLDKIKGLSYEEIAARGGGILNSSDLLNATSEDELYSQSMERVEEMMAAGTTSLEIKSGYGLCPEGELKMLRVIKRIRESVPAVVRSSFLGAHAVGRGYTKEAYVQEMVNLIPSAAELADFVDVFCDSGFFSSEETARILEAGARCGLRPKIHANELGVIGGVQVGVAHGALSVDHLEQTTDAEIAVLKGSGTMPTMLPGSSFFLGIPFGRAKEFISAGLGIALASDYNPGSSPMGDMRFVMALACIKMRLTPVQALNAVTLNGAYAMGISDITGSITPGKRADLILTLPGWTLTRIPYTYRTPWIRTVFKKGRS